MREQKYQTRLHTFSNSFKSATSNRVNLLMSCTICSILGGYIFSAPSGVAGAMASTL